MIVQRNHVWNRRMRGVLLTNWCLPTLYLEEDKTQLNNQIDMCYNEIHALINRMSLIG